MSRSLSRRCLLVAASAVLAATAAAPADETPDGGVAAAGEDAGLPPLPDLHTVSGTITQVSPAERAITVAARDGPVTITYDRTTSVYGHERLGSVRELVVGAAVRAQFGPEQRAYWIEVLSEREPGQQRSRHVPDGGS